ncbi:sec-independent protein translocase protein TatB [Mariprofundus ferrinatatus]|uniref:Sec-independent protein translocase protein TatB n=1 Tax=Mariprofundus ferrinatatus TaxID=1921087 RepID=A0A2K8L5I7_9PROT|nr:Sec-independent protein translocase protein TatB [Mariprofundus ferrinatatus]ATX82372.1 sec-independent protein translocase protein TatB [Mariprofundus ferrinatatus]
MPDIGFLELLLVGVIAFLVLGPERMPELFSQVGRVVRKGRDWVSDVKRQIDEETAPLSTPVTEIKDALSEGDISDINKEIMKKHGQVIDPAVALGSAAGKAKDGDPQNRDEASK